MQITLPTLLSLAALGAAQMNIACNSFGISDGYQGHDKWRGHDEHCQIAIDQLMENFGQAVPASEHGCTVLSEFETCQVSICDDYNVRRTVSYETVWAAAHVVHARHRGGNTVAGYVSLDDYTLGGNLFRAFVLVAAPNSPDPSGKRKRTTSEERRDVLSIRASDDHEFDLTEEPVPNTDDLNINVQAGWGNAEWAPNDQMQNAMENLLVMWDNGDDQRTTLRPAGYLAPNNIMIEFEFAAHQFNVANAVDYQERAILLRRLIDLRARQGNFGNFAAQVRRGSRVLGHVIIRVFRLVANQQIGQVCG